MVSRPICSAPRNDRFERLGYASIASLALMFEGEHSPPERSQFFDLNLVVPFAANDIRIARAVMLLLQPSNTIASCDATLLWAETIFVEQ
ncbi:hypothetical protein CHELA20_11103 [Hyphomicrobiales bacterium]|nr:hypothetical protein CHELA20_11103 [Hyphomicrobiales bacterium]CAH1694903.1 hypothetical protein CHELA41_51334 [Hyphomicrobiales bacterium]